MVDDAMVLLDNSGADLWVIQQETLGPYAESSSIFDDTWRGVSQECRVLRKRQERSLYLTTQVRRHGRRPGHGGEVDPGMPGSPGQPGYLTAGQPYHPQPL